jgi:hypothetical protein
LIAAVTVGIGVVVGASGGEAGAMPATGSATALPAPVAVASSSADVSSVPDTISVFPKSMSTGSWEWDGSCRFVPVADRRCQGTDPVFGPVVLNGDLWNLGSKASGSAVMKISSNGDLTTTAKFSSTRQVSTETWVLGFPNVSYGVSPQAASDSPKPSASLPLPMKITSLPADLIASSDYKLAGTSSVRYDLAYDTWLEPQRRVVTPRRGTIELMVWTADGNGALPPGFRENVSMSYAVNGVTRSDPWGVYIVNGDQVHATNTTVYLILTKPISDGKVSVDFTRAFRHMEEELKKYDPRHWSSFSNYYLDTIPLGSEFGRLPGKSALGPYTWDLYGYQLEMGMQLP